MFPRTYTPDCSLTANKVSGDVADLFALAKHIFGRFLKIESANSKTLKSRLVPLSERAAETLAELWQNSRRRESDLVFGGSLFKKAFNGACVQAKLKDVHFHDLRHTAITRWLEKGISPALAMKASGHSQMKTFLRYVNQSETSVAEFARAISKAA
ncbi:tyrosine-type recombinase/integrase [Leptolyngbya sp. 7M]|uniref:tyrosine-type recombinase/integrase n=1 Tax=Leptolyngbya sp. 7M TaxID=2812896 RepID=UPI001B8C71E4|nr:tyrosine-type recombinase/integrase [Leptolyngbya sp. 7M]QYO67506.1 tyrosine-type recombinase/integrase [Leptolyngbya sp. 7M]